MQVAEAKGLPKLKYHLLPRTKGFAVTVQCLRNVGKESRTDQFLNVYINPLLSFSLESLCLWKEIGIPH